MKYYLIKFNTMKNIICTQKSFNMFKKELSTNNVPFTVAKKGLVIVLDYTLPKAIMAVKMVTERLGQQSFKIS